MKNSLLKIAFEITTSIRHGQFHPPLELLRNQVLSLTQISTENAKQFMIMIINVPLLPRSAPKIPQTVRHNGDKIFPPGVNFATGLC